MNGIVWLIKKYFPQFGTFQQAPKGFEEAYKKNFEEGIASVIRKRDEPVEDAELFEFAEADYVTRYGVGEEGFNLRKLVVYPVFGELFYRDLELSLQNEPELSALFAYIKPRFSTSLKHIGARNIDENTPVQQLTEIRDRAFKMDRDWRRRFSDYLAVLKKEKLDHDINYQHYHKIKFPEKITGYSCPSKTIESYFHDNFNAICKFVTDIDMHIDKYNTREK